MLDSIFMQVLDMSNTASIVILVVLLARLLLKKAPKVFSYALWAVVLFRLLCPVTFEAPVSIMPEMASVSQDYSLSDAPISVLGAAEAAYHAVGDAVNGGLGVQDIRTTKKDVAGRTKYVGSLWWEVWISFGQYVWVAGMGVMFLYSAVSYLKIRKKLLIVAPLRDNIFLADDIKSPFVVGLFRPKIYLPCNLEEKEREYIILHEQHHIKRRDHIIKALAFLALSIHWFNPLVWVAFILASKDMEMSCDEAVLGKIGGDVRADYSASLLTLATGRRIIAGTPLAFGEGDTKSRIRNLANWHKPAFWVIAVSVFACAVVSICFLTNPPKDPGELPKWLENDNAVLEYILKHVEVDGKKIINGTYLETAVTIGSGAGYKKFRVITTDGSEYDLKANGRYYRDALITGPYGPGLRVTDIICEPVGVSSGAPAVPVTWTYSPMMSASWHAAFCFEFDFLDYAHSFEYTHIKASCDQGELWNLHGEEQSRNTEMQFEAMRPVCWTPSMNNSLAEKANVAFTVYDDETELYTGCIEITKTGEDGGRTSYEARLINAPNLYMLPTDSGTGAKIITVQAYEAMTSPDTVIWSDADLDHDGTNETIHVRPIYDGMAYELSVVKQDGTILWGTEAHTAHAGYNSLFVCTLDGVDYLLQYHPTMYQGDCNYTYRLFALDTQGSILINREAEVNFDINWGSSLHSEFNAVEIANFMDEVNDLLAHSKLLVSTDSALDDIDPVNPQDIPWWLRDKTYCSGYVYDESKSLRDNLLELESVVNS